MSERASVAAGDRVISRFRVDEMFREVFRGLKDLGGRAGPKDLFAHIAPRLHLAPHEVEINKSGNVRWQTLVRWYSVDCTKAGYIEKSGGVWILTPAGEDALKLPPGELIRSAQQRYREWKRAEGPAPADATEGVEAESTAATNAESEKAVRQAVYEQALETAYAGIEAHVDAMGAYDFQNLVAELLRAMGYHVSHVAPPGADGGIDIVAYRDPLGTTVPRIIVQVKHREQKAGAKEVRELQGLLRREGDIGLFISSGGFTADAEREARAFQKHIEFMDFSRFIRLWEEHYDKLRESGRAMLPLVRVHFLAPSEE